MYLEVSEGRHQRLYVQKFDVPPRGGLSGREQRLLKGLENAGELMARVYSFQLDERYLGANTYPHQPADPQLLRDEINADVAKDRKSRLKDPYTRVVRDARGQLHAIPYELAYKSELAPVISTLQREVLPNAEIVQTPYVSAIMQALNSGEHERSVEEWLRMSKEPKIDALIGFYDRYTDRLLNRKFFAEVWVGILNDEATARSQDTVDRLLAIWKKQDLNPRSLSPLIRVRIDHTTMFGGQAAVYNWTANNMPCQTEWREKYGSKFVVFQPNFEDKLKFERIPIMTKIADFEQKQMVTQDRLFDLSLMYYFGHEVCHPLIRRPDDEERLAENYSTLSEMYCTTLGMQLLNQLELTDEDRNYLIAMLFTSAAENYIHARAGKRKEYEKGSRAIFNYLFEEGAIKVESGYVRWSSPNRVFAKIADLNIGLEKIAANGRSSDVANLMGELRSQKRLIKLNPLREIGLVA